MGRGGGGGGEGGGGDLIQLVHVVTHGLGSAVVPAAAEVPLCCSHAPWKMRLRQNALLAHFPPNNPTTTHLLCV